MSAYRQANLCHSFALFRLRYTAFVATLGAMCLAGRPLAAGPIQFEFDATISSVEGDPTEHQLPPTLSPGWQLHGKLSFAGEEDLLYIFLHDDGGKQGQVTLTIDGTEIRAPINHGSINHPPIDINSPPPGPRSAITFGHFPLTNVYPPWAGGGISLTLVGPDGLISDPLDVLDASAWNQLTTSRDLEMKFGFPNTLTAHATIGEVRVVPEPSAIVTAILAAVFAQAPIRRRRSRSRQNRRPLCS